MNKKLAMVGICVAVGSALLFSTAFASISGTSGYDAYKSAIKNTMAVKSFTRDMQVSLKDNGNSLAEFSMAMKTDLDNNTLSRSVSVKSGNESNTTDTYRQDGKTITKSSNSDVYNVIGFMPGKFMKGKKEVTPGMTPSKMKDGEKVLDALVGNLQNYVTADNNADGSKEISVQLSGNQIPAAANAIVSMFVKNGSEKKGMPRNVLSNSFEKGIINGMPKLVDDIRVDSVTLKAEVNKDNYIQSQVADIAISGKDSDGKAHSVTIDLNMTMSGFNSTTPDKIDLTGKQVKEIQKGMARKFEHPKKVEGSESQQQ